MQWKKPVLLAALTSLLEQYSQHRRKGEHFGDFLIRQKHIAAVTSGRDFHKGANQ